MEENGQHSDDSAAPTPNSGSRARARDLSPSELTGSLRIVSELHRVADLLIAGKLPRQAMHALILEGYPRRTATRYVSAALSMLQRDDALEPLESKRARILAMALRGYETAMAKERAYVVQAGKDSQELKHVPDPDTKGAAMFLALIAKVEGLA